MTEVHTAAAVSLMHGWLPATVNVIAVVAVLAAVAGRPRRWFTRWLAPIAALGVAAAWVARWYMGHLGIASEPAPWQLWGWVALCALSVGVVFSGWRGSRWFRRNLTVFSASLCLLTIGLSVNGWIGYFPTVWTAWNQLTGGPLPDEIDATAVAAMQANGVVPSTGALVEVATGSGASKFDHRDEWVYLPPAWFASNPPPRLPTVMMIAGEFHTSADWVRAGDAVITLDAFAAANAGNAPVVVFVDSGGAFGVDTECVNGPRGNAADHLTKDVVPYMISHFGVSNQPANWGVAGFSSGGTCSLGLTAMHPDLFRTFVDIAGDRGPNAGSKAQTIDRLFGGDEQAWSSFDPATVIGAHSRYPDVAGLIVAPSGPSRLSSPDDEALCALGRTRGMSCEVVMLSGRHDWPSAAEVFAATLPWLAGQIQTPGVPDTRPPQATAEAGF